MRNTTYLNDPGAHDDDELTFFGHSVFVRFKGEYQEGVKDCASYYLLKTDGKQTFSAFPVNKWYNFKMCPSYRTLTAEEAEKRWSRSVRGGGNNLAISSYMCDISKCSLCRRNKVLNHFNIMIQHRLGKEDDEEEENGKSKQSPVLTLTSMSKICQ